MRLQLWPRTRELSCTGGPFETGRTWGVFQDVFCTREETFTFLQDVLTEVCALFPGNTSISEVMNVRRIAGNPARVARRA